MIKFFIASALLLLSSIWANAEDCSFINEQIKQINKVLTDNSTGPNDPKASFTADTTNKILTLNFSRNNSLGAMGKSMFERVAGMLPSTLLKTVYISTQGIVDGATNGNKLIEELQSADYKVVVIISGADVKYEFNYPSSALSLE